MQQPLASQDYSEVDLYLRVSTPDQTVERQMDNMRSIIDAYDDVQVFEDIGYSGGDRARPQLLQMKAHLNVPSRKPKLVIAYELDRLFRDCAGFLNFVENYCFTGIVHLYFVKNRMLIAKSPSEEQQLMFTMLALMAELERKRIARRTKERMTALKNQGRVFGRARDTSLDMQITDLHFAGKSTYAIAKQLNVSNGRVKRAKTALGYL